MISESRLIELNDWFIENQGKLKMIKPKHFLTCLKLICPEFNDAELSYVEGLFQVLAFNDRQGEFVIRYYTYTGEETITDQIPVVTQYEWIVKLFVTGNHIYLTRA